MKRYGQLFDDIVSWPNLIRAAKAAGYGKRMSKERASFEFDLENNLVELRQELLLKSYLPGRYRQFTIYDPKKRLISAAPYRDRVVHHALNAVIEPLFDRSFLPQNFANRKGRGLHLAVKYGSRIVNSYPYLLKADIRKYFPCIDHQILKQKIERKIKCRNTLYLIEKIIDNSNPQEDATFYFEGDDLFTPFTRRRGLPIGNLSSQLFANLYLDELDHYIVQKLHFPQYARYVDDFLIGGESKPQLFDVKISIEKQLANLRLRMHDRKTVVFPSTRGLTFLGFRFYPGKILAGKRCGKRFKARLKCLQQQYAEGKVDIKQIKQVIAYYNGHLSHGATERLRTIILDDIPFIKKSYTVS